MLIELRDGRSVTVDPDRVVSLTVRPDIDAGDPPTEIHLDEGSYLTDASIRTITEKLGDDCVLTHLDLGEDAWSASVALRKITHLTKPEENSENRDPTQVHMTNGQSFRAHSSIRTLSACLSLNAGIKVIDLDLPDTERPAACVADHVERCMKNRSPSISGQTIILLAGDWVLPTNDPVDWLSRMVVERLSVPAADDGLAPAGP